MLISYEQATDIINNSMEWTIQGNVLKAYASDGSGTYELSDEDAKRIRRIKAYDGEEPYEPKTEAEIDAYLIEAGLDPKEVAKLGVKLVVMEMDKSPYNPKNVKIAQLEAEIANLTAPDRMLVTKAAWERKQNHIKELEESLFNLHEELSKRNYACGQALDELYRNITHSPLPWEYPAQAQREIMQVVDQLRSKES